MEFGLFITVSFLLLPVGLSAAASRFRRQASVFSIISNQSIPCEELQEREGSGVPLVELTDEQKRIILRLKGGQYAKQYVATTMEEAMENFPSLLGLEQRYQELVAKRHMDTHQNPTKVTKRDIVNYMINNVYSGLRDDDSSADGHRPMTGHVDDKASTAQGNQLRQDYREFLESIADTHDVGKRAQLWRRWREGAGEDVNDFPLLFPDMLGISRDYTDERGYRVQSEMCFDRGSTTGPSGNYLRMCTVCTSTTAVDEDRWPMYMNEAKCSETDNKCLFVDGFDFHHDGTAMGTVQIFTAAVEAISAFNIFTYVLTGWAVMSSVYVIV